MKSVRLILAVLFVLGISSIAFADGETTATAVVAAPNSYVWAKYFSAAFTIAVAALGCSMGMGKALTSCFEGLSRNPSIGPRLMIMLVIGLALVEALAIYALVVSILILINK